MSKYGAKKVKLDGITFDSKSEGDYYLHLKRQKELGKIKDFDLQPSFELQPKFEINGVKFQNIDYVADFRIYNNDDTTLIIDVKGMITKDFSLKYKMYMYQYAKKEPLILIAYSKIDGGWVELKELKSNRKVRSKGKKAEKERKLAEQQLRESKYMINEHLEYIKFFINFKLECTDKFKNSLANYIKVNFHTINDFMDGDNNQLSKTYKKKIIQLKEIIISEKNN